MDPACAAILEQQRLAHVHQMEIMMQMVEQMASIVNAMRQGLSATQSGLAAVVQSVQANGDAARNQSGSSTGLREQIKSVVDPKILERLRDVSGRDEDFSEWSTKVSGLAALLGLDEVMKIATNEPDDDTVMSAQDVDGDVRGKPQAIYFMLLQACQGKAFSIVRAVQDHSGLWAWRKLCRECEPELASRHNAMLMSLLAPAWNDKTPLGTQLTGWGVRCRRVCPDLGHVV